MDTTRTANTVLICETLLAAATVIALAIASDPQTRTAILGGAMIISLPLGFVAGRLLSMAPRNIFAAAIVPGLFTLAFGLSVVLGSATDSAGYTAAGTAMVVLAVLLELIGLSLLALGRISKAQRCEPPTQPNRDQSEPKNTAPSG